MVMGMDVDIGKFHETDFANIVLRKAQLSQIYCQVRKIEEQIFF